MTRRTRDGGIVPSHVSESKRGGANEHYQHFGLKRGYVQRIVPASSPDNITGRLEYVVTIGGQDYPGVIDITGPGGIFQNHTRVRKGADSASESGSAMDSPVLATTYEEKKDGEIVFCMFIEGDGDIPVIIGGDEHPLIKSLNKDYVEPEGMFDRFEYNGLEFMIAPDGSYSIKCIGLKNPMTGIPVNPLSVGSVLSISKDGDLSFTNTIGTLVKLDSAGDKVEMQSSIGDRVAVSAADGVIVASSAGKVTVTGATEVSAKDVTGAGIKVATGKVAVGNSIGEIFALLEEVVNALSTATAPGFGAPLSLAPLMPPILVKIAAVKGTI